VLVRRSPATECGINSAEASENAPIYSGFCSKKVRTSSKKHRQIEEKVQAAFSATAIARWDSKGGAKTNELCEFESWRAWVGIT
ncbi:MAG: hypothetical protein U9O20_05020, partial [Patescibacteria group bacterium]|nr:hypothetical protein [Patescibacteria group bacterium]